MAEYPAGYVYTDGTGATWVADGMGGWASGGGQFEGPDPGYVAPTSNEQKYYAFSYDGLTFWGSTQAEADAAAAAYDAARGQNKNKSAADINTDPNVTNPSNPETPGGTPVAESDLKYWEEEPDMYPAVWAKQTGLPDTGRNPWQEWLDSQQGGVEASWRAKNTLNEINNPTAADAPLFADYLNSIGNAGGIGGERTAAYDSLKNALGMDYSRQGDFYKSMGDDQTAQLLYAALKKRFSAPVAQSMIGNYSNIKQGWQGNTQGGQTGDSFLNYIAQKYNLNI
jgi:hypothetical protein